MKLIKLNPHIQEEYGKKNKLHGISEISMK